VVDNPEVGSLTFGLPVTQQLCGRETLGRAPRWRSDIVPRYATGKECPSEQNSAGMGDYLQTSSNALLALASNLIIPVNKRTLGVVTPRPDVQLEKVGQVKSVRRSHELKVLTIK
jgi:hypothetical protein